MDSLDFVRGQLRATDRTLREIADGAGVGQSWLRMFARGEIPDPGYSKVKALADYFMRVGVVPVPLTPEIPPSAQQTAAAKFQVSPSRQAAGMKSRKPQMA